MYGDIPVTLFALPEANVRVRLRCLSQPPASTMDTSFGCLGPLRALGFLSEKISAALSAPIANEQVSLELVKGNRHRTQPLPLVARTLWTSTRTMGDHARQFISAIDRFTLLIPGVIHHERSICNETLRRFDLITRSGVFRADCDGQMQPISQKIGLRNHSRHR